MTIVAISRIVAGFLLAPLIGIFAANLFSFVLWAWRAHGIEVLSSAELLRMYVYVLVVGLAALAVARRLVLWGLLTWLGIGAICGLPACVGDVWFWYAASGGAVVDAEFVLRTLALYLFAGAVAGEAFWLLAVAGNLTLTRNSTRKPAGSASRAAGTHS